VTARKRAQEHLGNRNGADEARHLLFLTSFVSGNYEGALAHYAAIGKSYARLGKLDEPVLDAYTLGLGALQQDGHFLMPGRSGDNNFGGVCIDGLISHGFLKQYAWTIGFDSRQYIFSSE